MTLEQKISEWFNDHDTPFEEDDDIELVHEEVTDTSRWGVFTEYVYHDGTDYVRVSMEAPATEYQEWSGAFSIVPVEPYEAVQTRYRRIEEKS
jgi:hypothetical protein